MPLPSDVGPRESVQVVKEMELKEMQESELPALRYRPPPYSCAEQEMKVREESVTEGGEAKVEREMETAPPFCDEHPVNLREFSDKGAVSISNWNTAPFPDSRWMESNVFVSVRVSAEAAMEMRALVDVV